jgi:hypothetical protein
METEYFDELVEAWQRIFEKEERGEALSPEQRAMLLNRSADVAVAEIAASRYRDCFFR